MPARGAYAVLQGIADPRLRQTIKQLLDRIGALEGKSANIGKVTEALAADLAAGDQRIVTLADAVEQQDAVNLRTLQRYVQGVVTGAISAPPARPIPQPTGAGNPNPGPGTPPPGTPPPTPPPTGPTGPFPPPQEVTGNIRVAGKTLRTPSGQIYRWKSSTDFLLFKRFLDGENIAPILADRAAQGASMVRVFGMVMPPIATFDPTSYPNYLTQLGSFCDQLAGSGFDLEFTVFASAQDEPSFDSVPEQRAWLLQVRDVLVTKTNAVLELCNEPFQNGVVPRNHDRPIGVLSGNGTASETADEIPPWDYANYHSERTDEWPRKAHNAMEVADLLGRPAINDEPMGAAEVAIPGSRSDVPNDFYWFAATAMLLAGGGTFHSTNGLRSEIWQPVQQACAAAFYQGINDIPLDSTTGRYTRGPFADLPIQDAGDNLRTYARYDDHNATVVVIRPAGTWAPVAQGGWTIVGQAGPGGTVLYLTR